MQLCVYILLSLIFELTLYTCHYHFAVEKIKIQRELGFRASSLSLELVFLLIDKKLTQEVVKRYFTKDVGFAGQ